VEVLVAKQAGWLAGWLAWALYFTVNHATEDFHKEFIFNALNSSMLAAVK